MDNDGFMTDKETEDYIQHLENYEEIRSGSPLFNDYAHFASTVAREWHQKNSKSSNVSLSECIRAANTGLLLAEQLYRSHNRKEQFRLYSKPIILAELDRLRG